MNKLSYTYIAPGEENSPQHDTTTFRIQASSIASFIDYTSSWYSEKLLGQGGFEGNVSSIAGTVIHYMAEQFSLHGAISPEDKADIIEYIAQETAPLGLSSDEVLTRVRPMWAALKEYLSINPSNLNEPYTEVATPIQGIVAGGSIDSIIDLTDPSARYTSLDELPRNHIYKLVDYKTTSAKQPPKSFSRAYSWQLLTYAYSLSKIGINVTEIELVYILAEHIGEISPKTGKQMKSYPAQVVPLTKPITADDLAFIESLINLIAHSVHRFITVPADRFLLAQDYRLLNDTTPIHYASMEQPSQDI